MHDYTRDEVREALAPIASLISKSEKAQRKLAPGTWQHTMLQQNLIALRHAFALMKGESAEKDGLSHDDLLAALGAFDSMIVRTEKAGAGFAPGTSHHTLQRNRLGALRIAQALVRAESDEGRL